MSEEIFIKFNDQWQFNFNFDIDYDGEVLHTKRNKCCYCSGYLDNVYSYIINCLEKAGILHKSYEPICCYCKVLKEWDLLELRENLCCIQYFRSFDILNIHFNILTLHRDNKGFAERVNFDVNIHNYSKVKQD